MDIAEYGLTEHDLSFLKEKLDNSELITAHSNRSTTGEITSYTPAMGYTFYHINSYITVIGSASGSIVSATVSLKNDTTTKDILGGTGTYDIRDDVGSIGSGPADFRKQSTLPDKLVGNSSKKYSLNLDAVAGGVTVYGTIIGYIEAS